MKYISIVIAALFFLSVPTDARAQVERGFQGENPYMPGIYPAPKDMRLADIVAGFDPENSQKMEASFEALRALERDPDIGPEALMLLAIYTNTGKRKTYGPSYALIKQCTELYPNYAGCHVWMGSYVQFGVGIKKDAKDASDHYATAANLGSAAGQWSLGMSYLRGQGREQDSKTAFEWIEKSARQDYIPGIASYAIMKKMGDGTSKDDRAAFLASARGAYLGDARSFAILGDMFARGEGHEKDLYLADIAILRAASKGHEGSEKMVENLLKKLSPQDRAAFFQESKKAEPRLNEIIQDARLPE